MISRYNWEGLQAGYASAHTCSQLPIIFFLTCFVARMPHGTVERQFKLNIPDEDPATMILDLGLGVVFSLSIFFFLFFFVVPIPGANQPIHLYNIATEMMRT